MGYVSRAAIVGACLTDRDGEQRSAQEALWGEFKVRLEELANDPRWAGLDLLVMY